MNNAVYGENCEPKRGRMKIELTREARRTLTIVSKFDKFKVFGENIAALASRPRKIYWDTPTIVGATILDLAKFYKYQFHYGTMRSSFDCRLLYTDTDSCHVLAKHFEFISDKFKVFGENMAALSSRLRKIYWDTPTIVGATILDLG